MDNAAFQELKAQAFAIYEVEVQESLDSAEEGLLQLEGHPEDHDLINAVFRDLHTIKGSSAMNGVDNVAAFVHKLEDAYDRARDGELEVNVELIDVALQSVDYVRQLIAVQDDPEQTDMTLAAALQQRIEVLMGSATTAAGAGAPEQGMATSGSDSGSAAEEGENETVSSDPDDAAGEWSLYHIAFAPDEDLMYRGTNLIGLLEELSELGLCRILLDPGDVPPLETLQPQQVYLSWRILLATKEHTAEVEDVFMFVVEDSRLQIEQLLYEVTRAEAEALLESLFMLIDTDLALPVESLRATAKTLLLEDLRASVKLDEGGVSPPVWSMARRVTGRRRRKMAMVVKNSLSVFPPIDSIVSSIWWGSW